MRCSVGHDDGGLVGSAVTKIGGSVGSGAAGTRDGGGSRDGGLHRHAMASVIGNADGERSA